MMASAPLALQLAVYVLAILAFSTLFFAGFERPILAGASLLWRRAARSGRYHSSAARASPLGHFIAGLCAWPCGGGLGVLARNAFMADKPYAFYALLVATGGSRLRACGDGAPHTRPARPLWRRARSSCSRSRCLASTLSTAARPACRWSRRSLSPPIPIAPRTPIRPPSQTWWYYYLNEWIRADGIRAAIDAPDPQKKLPFVLVPGSSGRMFDTTIHINNLGFRGPALSREKGDAFRVVALGESQTFGPTLRDGEKPWPELLQDMFDQHASCGR